MFIDYIGYGILQIAIITYIIIENNYLIKVFMENMIVSKMYYIFGFCAQVCYKYIWYIYNLVFWKCII